MSRRKTIGFLTSNIHTGASQSMWPGLLDAAEDYDINLLCFPGGGLGMQPGYESQRNAVYDLVSSERVDGLVSWASTLGVALGHEEIKRFHERFRPLPVVSLALSMDGIPSIAVNSYDGMCSAIVHLIEVHGLRRIAFIRGPESHPYAQERFRAYQDVLQGYNIPFDPRLVTPPMDWEAGAEAVRLLLEERGLHPGEDFQAVVAVSDLLALAAMKTLQAKGTHVPGDLAVMGFNDYNEGRQATPPLSSVLLSFHEQGYRALESVVGMLAGKKVPDKVFLPTRLIVRQSCGCPSQSVQKAAAGSLPEAELDLKTALAGLTGALENELTGFSASPAQAKRLLEALGRSLATRASQSFLSTLEEILQQVSRGEGDVSAWQNVISALRNRLLPIKGRETHDFCEDLFHQARVLISDIGMRSQASRQLDSARQAEILRAIGQLLITTFDIDGLAQVLAERLPELGIRSCYLALYEGSGSEHPTSRLVLAYTGGMRFPLEAGGWRFSTTSLVPGEYLPKHRYSMVVEPLFFHEEQIGFVSFEIGPHQGSVYEVLRAQIASALKGAFLFQEAQQARRVAEKADRIKTRLLANVSHELRTPLNIILGCTSEALNTPNPYGLELPPALFQDLKHIQNSAEHQLRVINDLLDLSRAEINELDLYLELIDPRSLLEDTYQSFSAQSLSKDVVWRLELPERLPLIKADPVRLRQILLNLLSNAIRFTGQGSITLGAAISLPHLHLWVADTGIGISPQDQERIFEPFITAEHGGEIKGGIGLGLSITRWLVTLHGGKMALESQPGKGSVFHVYLPLPELIERRPKPEKTTRPVLLFISNSAKPAPGIEELCLRQGLTLLQARPSDNLEQILASQSPAGLVWDGLSATATEWRWMRRLSNHPALANIPLILYGGERGGLTGVAVKSSGSQPLLDAIAAIRPSQAKGTVLIVDDDPKAIELHQKAVSAGLAEYQIQSAENGKTALEMMAQEPPGLVILDLMMPEMDGFEVLERMRANPHLLQVPVVILSNKLLSSDDIKRLEKYTHVMLQTKGILTQDEMVAAFQRAVFGSEELPTQSSLLVKRTLAYLHQNYTRPLARWEIAEAIGVSEDYLSRVFLKELGLSLWDYLNRFRIYHAQNLLRFTVESIQAIAQAVGFKDPAYFSRVFRDVTGISPSAFRSQPNL